MSRWLWLFVVIGVAGLLTWLQFPESYGTTMVVMVILCTSLLTATLTYHHRRLPGILACIAVLAVAGYIEPVFPGSEFMLQVEFGLIEFFSFPSIVLYLFAIVATFFLFEVERRRHFKKIKTDTFENVSVET